MFGMGSQELLIILLIGLVLFGGSKLPELARSLGRSMTELKKGMREGSDDKDQSGKTPKAGG